MNVSAINLTNQKKNFGQSGVEQLVKVADTVSKAKELNADTIKDVADCIEITNDTPKNTKLLMEHLKTEHLMGWFVRANINTTFVLTRKILPLKTKI